MTAIKKIILLTLATCAVTASAKPVPDLKFQDLTGHPQKLSSLRGSIAVISFWATWCAPCKEELPRLSALQSKFAAQAIRFIAISVDEPKDRPKIAPYLQLQHITLEPWLGADLDTLDRLSLGNHVPATLILDKDGTPITRIEGEATDADLLTILTWLLSDRSTPAPPPLLKRY